MQFEFVVMYPDEAVGDGERDPQVAVGLKGDSWTVACLPRVTQRVRGALSRLPTASVTPLSSEPGGPVRMKVTGVDATGLRQALETIAREIKGGRHVAGPVNYALHGAD